MKHLIFFIYSLLLLPMAGNALAQTESLQPYDSTQAETVMNQYFAALASGDVATLKTLLGGRLKAKRAALLNNPEYAGYLATTHANASFEIQGMHSTAQNIVSVYVVDSFKPDENMHKKYTLRRNAAGNADIPYRIVSEATSLAD